MGQKKSRLSSTPILDDVVLRRITSVTTFLPDEIQYFYYDFLKYTPTGYLTLADFEKFYQSLFRRGIPENFAKYAFNVYDTNGDGIVDFEEFITALYYTTKATPIEKIRWAFDLCDLNNDHKLDQSELENIILALYELSDADMSRVESDSEAIERVKHIFLLNKDNNEVIDGISKIEFVDIIQKDTTTIKLIDCRPSMNKRASRFENTTANLFKKQLKFEPTLTKSLSDSTLTKTNEND